MERRVVWSPASAVLMLGVFLFSFGAITPRAWAVTNNKDNANVGRLLNQADYQAHRLNNDANQMTALINSDVGWTGRERQLVRVKHRVNNLGKDIYKLQSPRADASQWQKQSINNVARLLRFEAVNTTDEIDYLNQHQGFPNSPQFNHLANQSANMAQKLSGKISDIVRYGKDRRELGHLSNALKFPGHTTRTNG